MSAMRTLPIVCVVCAIAHAVAQTDSFPGSGHADTTRLSLLAKDLKPAPEPAVPVLPQTTDLTLPRPRDITLPHRAAPLDRTDLIATPADQERVLRSLRIDPSPQPPAAPAKAASRPLGNAAQKH